MPRDSNLITIQPELLSAQEQRIQTYVQGGWNPVAGTNDSPGGGDGVDTDAAGQTMTKYRPQTARPSLYKVILLNDDFTPMDFVILILKKFFRHNDTDANRIMLEVHNQGAGVAGIYPFEVAETKVFQVNDFSRNHQRPLKCIMEKEEV